jgi:multidrug efflux system membrane fusion protein
VINEMKPIYVTFTLPEKDLPQIKDAMANGALSVTAQVPGEEDKPVTGDLTFLDNAVDQNTGTIRFKATFANEDNRLWPGQFVNVVLRVKVLDNATVAPASAVQVGQDGPYVFVVKPDMTVELRKVVPGDTVDAKTVITDGLKPGEQVVTDGQMRLIPGASVKVITENAGQEAKSE